MSFGIVRLSGTNKMMIDKIILKENEMENIKLKILHIINKLKNTEFQEEELKGNIDAMGITSLEFMKLIVEIEEEFNIEFEVDKLSKTVFDNLEQLEKYIAERVKVEDNNGVTIN